LGFIVEFLNESVSERRSLEKLSRNSLVLAVCHRVVTPIAGPCGGRDGAIIPESTKEAPHDFRRNRPERAARGRGAVQPVVPGKVTFSRRELDRILGLYGRMVAAGEWRDYAIDFLRDRAVFSVFRRASEVPLYRIEKNPKLARKQGAYSVISATGLIVKRGHELDGVLRAVDKSLKLVTT
jgi:hypothetical protein